MRRIKSWLKWILLLGLLAGGYFYWQSGKEDPANIPPPYITAKVSRGDLVHSVLATGALQAFKEVKVGAQVSGKIAKLHVEIGDKVKAGDKIAEIDADTQQNQRDSEKASLDVSKANLRSAQARLAEAQKKYNRQKSLGEAGTKENLDSAKATLGTAQAEVAAAQAQIEKSQLALKNASVNLGYTTVTAPMDGVVVAVAVEEGQSINAVQSSPTIITLAQTDTITVAGEIAEADVGDVKTGMKASFTLLGKDKTKYEGVIKSIDPAPLAVSNNSSSSSSNDSAVYYYGKMDVKNPNERLKIGMTANMTIKIKEAKNALTIPMTALQKDDEVLLPGPNPVAPPKTQKITVGINDGVNVEVLEGLSEGQEVIVSTKDERAGQLPPGMSADSPF